MLMKALARLVLSIGLIWMVPAQSLQAATFEQARVLRAQQDYAGAATLLRDLLRKYPNDIALREELGYVLLLDGQMAAAQHQFTLLNERVSSPELRGLYRAVLRRIVNERPAGVELIFSLTPSSNINQGTDARTVESGVLGVGTVDPESRRVAGWQSRIGLKGFVRGNVSARGQITFDWRAERRLFSELISPETQLELGITYAHSAEHVNWGIRAFGLIHRSARADYDYTGLTAFGSAAVAPKIRLDGRLQVSDLNFGPNDTRNGPRVSLEPGVQFAPRAATAFRFSTRIERAQAERVAARYTSVALTAQVSHAFRNGVDLSAQAIVGERRYDSDLEFARRDTFESLSMTVFNSRYSLRGIVPKLTCSVEQTHSNVAVFESTQQACGISLSRRF